MKEAECTSKNQGIDGLRVRLLPLPGHRMVVKRPEVEFELRKQLIELPSFAKSRPALSWADYLSDLPKRSAHRAMIHSSNSASCFE
jgi:hypothetical protein